MAQIKFNHVDTFTDGLAAKLKAENKNHHWQFKTLLTMGYYSGKRAKICNATLAKAKELSVKYNCVLQDGCQSPLPTSGGGKVTSLVNYIFHGENCFTAAAELDKFYFSIIDA